MKKILLAVAALILLTAGGTFGQGLKKGNLVGVHIYSVKLNPGVTIEQFTNFCINKLFPEWEKNFQGLKLHLGKRIRGLNDQTELGLTMIFVFASEKDRDKYFTAAGETNELGKALFKKIEPINAELGKLGSLSDDRYTDWLIY